MNEINDTTLLIMGTILIIPDVYLLMVFKDIKVVIAGLIILIGSQVAVFALHVDPYWHVMALLLFPIIMIGYMTVKIKQRINAALKRIAQLEEEERQEKEREARKEKIRAGAAEMADLYRTDPKLKELNDFVGDYRDDDSV
ncbi:MAG: hypothetical protein NT103_02795 [Campylobacterales bacterium]|nr:hypothetical protein [Campylobacterales bacterium]